MSYQIGPNPSAAAIGCDPMVPFVRCDRCGATMGSTEGGALGWYTYRRETRGGSIRLDYCPTCAAARTQEER